MNGLEKFGFADELLEYISDYREELDLGPNEVRFVSNSKDLVFEICGEVQDYLEAVGTSFDDANFSHYGINEIGRRILDIAAGVIDEQRETIEAEAKRSGIFNHYKDRLVNECGAVHGRIRFNVIEYLCSFPEIDPVEMAAALKLEGQKIDFDDSSISRSENVRKMKMVERRVDELSRGNRTVDGIVRDAKVESKKTEVSASKDSRELVKD